MALDLIDLRAKIDEVTDAWLHCKQTETGKERSELVREILHEKATVEIHNARLLMETLRGKGIDGERQGKAGV